MKEKRKQLVMVFLLVSVLLVGVILVEGCKKSESRAPVVEEGGAKWVCPDHPDIIESRPVKCRRCGKELVPLEEEEKVE